MVGVEEFGEIALRSGCRQKYVRQNVLNPNKQNGCSHSYQMGESIVILGASGVIFHLYFL